MKPLAKKNSQTSRQKNIRKRSPGLKSKTPPSEVIKLLKDRYPNAHCELDHADAFQLLIATILSAQCTDERVNIVTKELFKKYPSAQQMSKADVEDLEQLVRSTGFFKNKAKNIKSCALNLVEKHQGQVPDRMGDLVDLAGVGRKTANVVLGNAFGIPSGIVVDTHVSRLSHRFGWSKSQTPEKIENDLQKIIPKEDWILISHLLIWHGRRHCKARSPGCTTCFLFDHCPKLGV